MDYQCIQLDAQGPLVTITINRPKVLNALNTQVIQELRHAINSKIMGSEARVVVLTGAGDKAFVAGADIAGMREMTSEQALEFARRGQDLTRALESLNQVTVARVNGFALGGGCELAMACDIVIAARDAKFGQPEVNLGLIPGFGGTQRLVRRVGLAAGLDMLLTSRTITADEALQIGLISRVTDRAQLDEEVRAVVNGVLKAAPSAISEAKRLAREAYTLSLDAGLAAEASSFASCFSMDEAREGMAAFIDKRPAGFVTKV